MSRLSLTRYPSFLAALDSDLDIEIEQSKAERILGGAEPIGIERCRFAFRDYRGNIVDKTARRYCSREISIDNSMETSCETLPWLTIDCYISKISSFLPPPFPLSTLLTLVSIAFESHGDKFSFSLMKTVDSTWFSSARFLFVDDDRQAERTSGCRSTIASSSSKEEVFVDTARERTRRTRTDH